MRSAPHPRGGRLAAVLIRFKITKIKPTLERLGRSARKSGPPWHHTLLGVPGTATPAQGGRIVRTTDTVARTAETAASASAAAAAAAAAAHSNNAITTEPSARNYRVRPCLARHPRLRNPRHPDTSFSPTCTFPSADPCVYGGCPCPSIS